MTRGPLALALIALTAGCARPTLATHVARQRDYAAGSYAQRDPGSQPGNGSLFSDAIAGYLEDTRAVRVGDPVVRIDEHADARGGATTDLRRESSANLGIANVLGLIPALRTAVPELDPTRLPRWRAA